MDGLVSKSIDVAYIALLLQTTPFGQPYYQRIVVVRLWDKLASALTYCHNVSIPKSMLRTHSILLITSIALCVQLHGQAPDSLWTRSYGSSLTEVGGQMSVNSFGNNMASAAFDLVDGGLYVSTYTPGNDGWVSTNNGEDDIWVLKLDANGDTLWTRVLGGIGIDRVYRMRAVSTGGVILAGRTTNGAGLCTGFQGQTDGLLVRLDASGNTLWSRCMGGSEQDFFYDVAENPAGNFVACGESGSTNGDLAGAGNGLAWVQIVNGLNGVPVVSYAPLGPNGSNPDALENFTIVTRMSTESAYLLGGFTSPSFSDFNLDDIWVAKMDVVGNVLWSRSYGSTNARDGSAALVELPDGGFIIAGLLGGNGGFPQYLGGNGDGLLIHCDTDGNVVWSRNYGGSDWEYFNDATLDADGKLLVAGFSRSTNAQLTNTQSYGNADHWLLKVEPSTGDTIWTKRMGGPNFDAATGVASSGTTNYLAMVGRSDGQGGWISGNNGGRDLWVVRLSGDFSNGLQNDVRNNSTPLLYPNPANHVLALSADQGIQRVRVQDIRGRLMLDHQLPHTLRTAIDVSPLPNGIYLLDAEMQDGSRQRERFVVQH